MLFEKLWECSVWMFLSSTLFNFLKSRELYRFFHVIIQQEILDWAYYKEHLTFNIKRNMMTFSSYVPSNIAPADYHWESASKKTIHSFKTRRIKMNLKEKGNINFYLPFEVTFKTVYYKTPSLIFHIVFSSWNIWLKVMNIRITRFIRIYYTNLHALSVVIMKIWSH